MITNNTIELKRQTAGRWIELLEQAGIPGEYLDGRGHPCPRCGGTDRFSSFRDVAETGGVHCRHCFTDGADGFAAIAWLLDLPFPAVLNWVSDHLGRATRLQTARASLPRGESFASCHDAVAALDRFMARRHSAKRTGLWTYRRDGEPVAVVVRYDGDRKTYRPVSRHPDGWRWSDPPGLWPLYRELPDELQTVYVAEGEKCVDAAKSLGLVGVTSAHGAGSAHKSNWSPLGGARRVVILPDNDAPGGRYAAEVESIVRGLGVRDVRVVDLPGLPPGGDIVDWMSGRDRADLLAELRDLVDNCPARQVIELLPAKAPPRRPKLIRLSDVQPEPVRWLWPGRIALGKLTLLAGDPGLGKSFMTMDLTARVSVGATWPDSPTVAAPMGSVILLSAEDDLADTIRPRLDAAGADCSRVVCLQAVTTDDEREQCFCLTTDVELLEAAIASLSDCRLIVIDPITAYLGGTDSHRNAEIRAVLAPLADLASKHGVAVVAVTHLNKSVGGPAIYRSMGSLAFTAAARAVWSVSKDPCDLPRRLVLPVKNNVAADGSGLAYRIMGDPPRVEWEPDPVTLTADEALSPAASDQPEFRTERDAARAWLREILADGPRPSKEVLADGKELGHCERTLRRAFRELCGMPQKTGLRGGWTWSLPPEDCQPSPEDCDVGHSF